LVGFEEIGERKTHTLLDESEDFLRDITELEFPDDTILVVIVNPNSPTGSQHRSLPGQPMTWVRSLVSLVRRFESSCNYGARDTRADSNHEGQK
jgi:hypothetical protein